MTTTRTLRVPGDEWDHVRRRVAPFACREAARPILAGVQLSIRDGQRTWLASDSYMLARYHGGETKAGDVDRLLLPRSLFAPARPKPSTVIVAWNRSTITVTAPEWERPRTAPAETREPPDLDAVIDKAMDKDYVSLVLDRLPRESSHDYGALPIMANWGDGAFCRPNGTWEKVGECIGWGPVLISLNLMFARRCFKAVEEDRGALVDVGRPKEAVRWIGNGVSILQMPVRSSLSVFLDAIA